MTEKANASLVEVHCIKCDTVDAFFEHNVPPKYICSDCEEKQKEYEREADLQFYE